MKDLTFTTISDTHNHHDAFTMPGGDFLIHAGDATSRGEVNDTLRFLDWFGDQDYSHLILVPGNHDWIFERNPDWVKQECKDRGIHLLMDSGVELEGIKFWGSPVQPWFYDWAFNRRRGSDIKKHWDLIPTDTEVLITHGPPHGKHDEVPRFDRSELVGCQDLMDRIQELPALRLHVFGHIHEGRGHSKVGDLMYVNAASLDGRYRIKHPDPTNLIRDPSGRFKVST